MAYENRQDSFENLPHTFRNRGKTSYSEVSQNQNKIKRIYKF